MKNKFGKIASLVLVTVMLALSLSLTGCSTAIADNAGRYVAIAYSYYIDSNGIVPLNDKINASIFGTNTENKDIFAYVDGFQMCYNGDTIYLVMKQSKNGSYYRGESYLIAYNIITDVAEIVLGGMENVKLKYFYKDYIIGYVPGNQENSETKNIIINLAAKTYFEVENEYIVSNEGILYYTEEETERINLRLCKIDGNEVQVTDEYELELPVKQNFSIFDVYGDCVVTNDYIYNYETGIYSLIQVKIGKTRLKYWYLKRVYNVVDDSSKIYLEESYYYQKLEDSQMKIAAEVAENKKELISVERNKGTKSGDEKIDLKYTDGSDVSIPKSKYKSKVEATNEFLGRSFSNKVFDENRMIIYSRFSIYNSSGEAIFYYNVGLVDGEKTEIIHIGTIKLSFDERISNSEIYLREVTK